MARHFASLLTFSALSSILSLGCSDKGSSSQEQAIPNIIAATNPTQNTLHAVDTIAKIPDCLTVSDLSLVYFVIDTKDFYFCDTNRVQQKLNVQGNNGTNGLNGKNGTLGDKGLKGDKGDKGPKGAKGNKGDKGIPGTNGPQGIPGSNGSGGASGGRAVGTTVDLAAQIRRPSLFKSGNTFHATSYQNLSTTLMYSTCSSNCADAANWTNISIDSSGAAGDYSSITGNDSKLFISYSDSTNHILKIATCSLSTGCMLTSDWTTATIESTSSDYLDTSIALTTTKLYVSHFNSTTSDLRIAECTLTTGCASDSNWTFTALDTIGDVGRFNSLVISTSGDNTLLNISYFDATNTNLKFTTCNTGIGCTNAGNWDIAVVDTDDASTSFGINSTITTDSSGDLHIIYQSSALNGQLKYATCSSDCGALENWTKAIIDPLPTSGYGTSIAISENSGKKIHIIHGNYYSKSLRYGSCTSDCITPSNWTYTRLDGPTPGAADFSGSGRGPYSHVLSADITGIDAIAIGNNNTVDTFNYLHCTSDCENLSSWQ